MGDPSSARDRRFRAVLFWASLALLSAVLVAIVVTQEIGRILVIVPDDVGYFLKIAENVARGAGESFDGLNASNGYQPLWLYLLVPMYAIASASPETMIRFVLGVQVALLVGATALLSFGLAGTFTWRAALPVGLVYLTFVVSPAINGMESALLLSLLAVLLVLGLKFDMLVPGRIERDILFGLVLGLVVLARLDTVFLAVVVCSLYALRAALGRSDRAAYLRTGLLVGVGVALVLLPYLLRNYAVHGHFGPISGALKSSFPAVSVSPYVFERMGRRDLAAFLLVEGYLLFLGMRWVVSRVRDTRQRAQRDLPDRSLRYFELAAGVLAGAVTLHFLHTALFMTWGVFRWHFVLYSAGAALVALLVARVVVRYVLPGRLRLVYWPSVLIVSVFCGLAMERRYLGEYDNGWIGVAYDAALWAREHTDEDDVFAMKDAGTFGYFSRRAVVNLDGLVNGWEYQEVLRERRLEEYLSGLEVDYIVQHAFWGREDVAEARYDSVRLGYVGRYRGVFSDSLTLRREWEAYRSEPFFDGPLRTALIVWKLPKSKAA